MVLYKVNWEETDEGNSIKSGEVLEIKVGGAEFISGGIYKDNLPIYAIFEMGNVAKIDLKFRDKNENGEWFTRGLLAGDYTLKTRAHIPNSGQYMNGWEDDFLVTA